MDPILDTIEEALRLKGLSDAAASKLAVGHPSLVKNMRISREGEKRYNLPALQKLADVLDLEFYFGPRRDLGPVEHTMISGEDFAAISRLDVQLSAGSGSENSTETVVERLAFRREWLNRLGVNPSDAVIVSVRGDSMEPGLHDGDLALIDQARKALRTGRIYALTDIDGATRVKRIEILQGQGFLLRSDNLAYPVEARLNDDSNRMKIIGQVVWSGHTHKA